MGATLKQIAEETGLSVSTVSRVTTGKGYVSDEARRLVEEAVQRLSYSRRPPMPQIRKGGSALVILLVGCGPSDLATNILE